MKIVELIIDDNDEMNGIDAISIVENPAIEEDFVALKKQVFHFAELDKDKRLLVGPLLIPNKPIFRQTDGQEYYIFFSRDTIKKASQRFLQNGNQSKSTLEHAEPLEGLTLVESWLVEDVEKDKSRLYDLNVPVGTWMGAVKVENDEIWNKYVKEGKVKGFSIEGYFADKYEEPQEKGIKEDFSLENHAQELVEEILQIVENEDIELESYNDYPSGVSNNAKKVLDFVEKNGWGDCGTPVGKQRANQLANKEKISVSTIKRMNSYLTRHAKDLQASTSYTDGCGKLMYDSWGGKAALRWSASKLKQLDLKSQVVDDDMAIIEDRLAYSTMEKAEEMARAIGCEGHHVHEFEGKQWYMPCKSHAEEQELKEPCWAGYEMVGFKMKNGKKVPNCVPIKK